jgi:hypothetical protein
MISPPDAPINRPHYAPFLPVSHVPDYYSYLAIPPLVCPYFPVILIRAPDTGGYPLDFYVISSINLILPHGHRQITLILMRNTQRFKLHNEQFIFSPTQNSKPNSTS